MNILEGIGFGVVVFCAALGGWCVLYAVWTTAERVKRQVLRGGVEEIADLREAVKMRDDDNWLRRQEK